MSARVHTASNKHHVYLHLSIEGATVYIDKVNFYSCTLSGSFIDKANEIIIFFQFKFYTKK